MTNEIVSDLSCADTLWKAADALRGQVDAAEYEHVKTGRQKEEGRPPTPTKFFIPTSHFPRPPFNVSDYSGPLLRGDKRWTFGDPPVGNANYAWNQHFIQRRAAGGGDPNSIPEGRI